MEISMWKVVIKLVIIEANRNWWLYRIEYGEGKEKEMRTTETKVAYLNNPISEILRDT